MALLDKWQTILLTSWKWQLLVGTSFGGLLLLIVGIWLLRRRRRNRLLADGPDLMFGVPDDIADQPTVSFRDDWADPYALEPVVSVVEVIEAAGPDAEVVDDVVDTGVRADAGLVAANDAWLTPAPEQSSENSPGNGHDHGGDVEIRIAKLEAAVVALTDLLRPARVADAGAGLTERLDALEQTLTARFDALARVLSALPTGGGLPGSGTDPEAVAAAVVEIRRTLRG